MFMYLTPHITEKHVCYYIYILNSSSTRKPISHTRFWYHTFRSQFFADRRGNFTGAHTQSV